MTRAGQPVLWLELAELLQVEAATPIARARRPHFNRRRGAAWAATRAHRDDIDQLAGRPAVLDLVGR